MNDLEPSPIPSELTSAELTRNLHAAVALERGNLMRVLSLLDEFDRRSLALRRGFSSTFIYCTKVLGYSRDAAYRRTRTMHAARDYPALLAPLAAGEITMTTVTVLAPILTDANHRALIERAKGLDRQQVERLVAEVAPRRDVPDRVRGLRPRVAHLQRVPPRVEDLLPAPASAPAPPAGPSPTGPSPAGPSPAGPSPAGGVEPAGVVEPREAPPCVRALAPERVEFRFTGSEGLERNWRRARALLGHKFPFGRMEEVFGEALEVFLDQRDPLRRATRRRERQAAA